MRFLLVDGHSVIFAWRELALQHAKRSQTARDMLVRTMRDYQDSSGVRVVLVFDGRGVRTQDVTEPGGIQVFYSRTDQTADAIIERLVAKYAKKYPMTVATDDNLERQTAMSFGAEWISTEQLRSEVASADREMRGEMDRLKRRR